MKCPSVRVQQSKGVEEVPVGKIVCVGRNYAEHAKELNNPLPDEPLLFIKPNTSAASLLDPIKLEHANTHFETELAILIGSPLKNAEEHEVSDGIAAYGLALDLTLREKQSELKAKGLPWERAKAFDGACPLSDFVPASTLPASNDIHFSLELNGILQQEGHTSSMLFPIVALIANISKTFTLLPGDVVLTGTPAGVGQLCSGDHLKFSLQDRYIFETSII